MVGLENSMYSHALEYGWDEYEEEEEIKPIYTLCIEYDDGFIVKQETDDEEEAQYWVEVGLTEEEKQNGAIKIYYI